MWWRVGDAEMIRLDQMAERLSGGSNEDEWRAREPLTQRIVTEHSSQCLLRK
jgi:hypothetical protein